MYLNGVNVRYFTSTELPADYVSAERFGNWTFDQNRPYAGYLGPVLIYDRVLSPEEVVWLYREPYAVFFHWHKLYYARPETIELAGSLAKTIELTGSLDKEIALSGGFTKIIELTGNLRS